MRSPRGVLWVGSRLLSYPSGKFWQELPALERSVADLARSARDPFERFILHLHQTDPLDVEEEYVRTFDLTDHASLYLTYSRDREGRDRGPALAALLARYRAAVLEIESRELPDYLPLLLEFLALRSDSDAAPLAGEFARKVSDLASALTAGGSPYADVVTPAAGALHTLAAGPAARWWGR